MIPWELTCLMVIRLVAGSKDFGVAGEECVCDPHIGLRAYVGSLHVLYSASVLLRDCCT